MDGKKILHQTNHLTLTGLRIIDYAAAFAKESKDLKANIALSEIKNLIKDQSSHAQEKVQKACTQAMDYSVLIEDSGKTCLVPIFKELSYSNNTLNVELNETYKPYVNSSLIKDLALNTRLTNKHAYVLYSYLKELILKSQKEELSFDISVAELENKMRLIALPETPIDLMVGDIFVEVFNNDSTSAYKRFNNFNQLVLTPAISDINQNSDLYVEVANIKEGVAVTGIHFLVRTGKQDLHEKRMLNRLKAYQKLTHVSLLSKSMPDIPFEDLSTMFALSKGNINAIFDAYIEGKNNENKDLVSYMINRLKT